MNPDWQQFSVLQEIQKNHLTDLPTAESIKQILGSSEGVEPIEEGKYFFNRQWNNVTPEGLHEHFSAFYYFNDIFYKYYLPSVLVYGLLEFEMVSDAVLLIIRDMSDSNRGRLDSSYATLNRNQLVSLSHWLAAVQSNTEEYLHIKEWNLARDNMESLSAKGHNC